METRWVCAGLMAAAGALLIAPLPTRVKRGAWVVLAVAATWNGVALNARPANLVANNLVHYWLGAKYPVPYADFYRAVQAARDTAQVGMRDLARPKERVRAGKWERRAYYIDLLRAEHVAFDPLQPLDSLAARAHTSGAVHAEADRILAHDLPARLIAPFRRDVSASVGAMRGRPFVDDYGFNGSPFYVLVRSLDPSLYVPFNARLGWMGLLGEFLCAIAFVWVAGSAIGLGRWERVASIALLFSSWDFVGYVLPGLVFGGVWIPVAVAAWAMGRRRPVIAGSAIAWAGLLKLFPFVLLLPAVSRLARARFRPRPDATPAAWAGRLLLACGVATLVLGGAAELTGHRWAGFFAKITAEFHGVNLLNNVSLGQTLAALGVSRHSLLLPLLALGVLVLLAAVFFGDRAEDEGDVLARRTLVLATATGLFLSSWINYYALVPLVMAPWYARERPRLMALVVASFALAFTLPEFDARLLRTVPALHVLKLLPYAFAPVAMLALELHPSVWPSRARRFALGAAQVLLVLTLLETGRMAAARHFEKDAEWQLAHGDLEGAIASDRRVLQLVPGNAAVRAGLAQALALSGRAAEAEGEYANAVATAPDDPILRGDLATLLMAGGRWDEAGAQLDAARTLSPDDEPTLRSLALVRSQQGRHAASDSLFARARELDPDDAELVAMRAESGAH